jgi:hypothetical protein
MIAKPNIHPLAKTHLRELADKLAALPGEPLTLEEQLWIVRLCEAVVNPVSGLRADLIGQPERCGMSDVWLWHFSVGASIWYRDLACTWWQGDSDRLFWALAFALANGRDKAVLQAARTRDAASGLVYEWSLSLSCERAEIEDAVDRILADVSVPAGAKAPAPVTVDWNAIVADLETQTGIVRDHWLWDLSREETLSAWSRSRRIIEAMRGQASSEPFNEADYAAMDLHAAKAAILASRRIEQPEAQHGE